MKNKKKFIALGSVLAVLVIVLVIILTLPSKSYKVSFDTNGGNEIKEITVKKDETIELPKDPVKEGYLFKGWLLDDKEFDKDTKITEDIKLTAKWVEEDKKITVKFDSNGGTKIKDITLKADEKLKLPKDPIKKGYKFITWKDKNEVPISNGALLSEDITLYAYYEKNKPAKKEPTTSKPNLENPDKNKNDKPTDSKPELKVEKTYYCDKGYTLEGTKCTKIEKVERVMTCPENTKKVGEKCLNINSKADKINICKKKDGKLGIYNDEAHGCYYSETAIPGVSPETCKNNEHGFYYNGHCYKEMVQTKGEDGAPVMTCPKGYEKYQINDHSNPICVKIEKSNISCPKGFNYNSKAENCEKTITVDAKVK